MARSRSNLEAVIPITGTDSAAVTAPTNSVLLGIHVPAGMTGTALKFKAGSTSASTPATVKKEDGTDYSVTIAATASFTAVNPMYFEGVEYLTVVSNAAEAAERTLTLAFGQP